MRDLEDYLKEADRIRRSRNGSPQSRNQLVAENLLLVVKIANRISRKFSTSIDDLIQEGNIGLIKAAERYDPSRGTKFSTYATWWIRAFVLKYLADENRIKTTKPQISLQLKVFRIIDDLMSETGERPTYKEIAERLNTKIKKYKDRKQRYSAEDVKAIVEDHYTIRSKVFSFDGYAEEAENGDNHMPITSPNQLEATIYGELRKLISDYLGTLTETEMYVVRRFYYEGAKVPQIAEELGIPIKTVKSIQLRSISRLRTAMSYDKRVPSFLQTDFSYNHSMHPL